MSQAEQKQKQQFPPQHQDRQPGIESEMRPRPDFEGNGQAGCKRLEGKVAIITGGDSGIGRAVAVAYAQEGADVVIVYLDEHNDADETRRQVEQEGRRCIGIAGDVGDESFCRQVVSQTIEAFGRLDILVNNAAVQYPQQSLEQISAEQLEKTFRTNIFAYFYMAKAALKHLKEGASIINTTSVTAYRGNDQLIDYSATKGAIVAFTRSLSKNLAEQGVRVNGVAPGPIWTPLIPATFDAQHVSEFGADTPLGRAGQPVEVAPSYVFLASDDASYMTGQVLHPNGGEMVES